MERLYPALASDAGKSMINCDRSGIIMMFIYFALPKVLIGRIFSGTITHNSEIGIASPNRDTSTHNDFKMATGLSLFLCMEPNRKFVPDRDDSKNARKPWLFSMDEYDGIGCGNMV